MRLYHNTVAPHQQPRGDRNNKNKAPLGFFINLATFVQNKINTTCPQQVIRLKWVALWIAYWSACETARKRSPVGWVGGWRVIVPAVALWRLGEHDRQHSVGVPY